MQRKFFTQLFCVFCFNLFGQETEPVEAKVQEALSADTSDMYYNGEEIDTTTLIDKHALYLQDTINKRNFDKNKWQEITKEFDYTEAEKKLDSATTKKKYKKTMNKPNASYSFWKSFARFALIAIAVFVIAFVLYKLLKRTLFLSNTALNNEVFNIEKIEENLHESDLDAYLQKAISEKNYRLAVRLYYLMVIKELSVKEWIKWKKDKTNYEYLVEMSSRENYTDFREITQTFEYAWYGENTIEENLFLKIVPHFDVFLKNLKTNVK
jgi:hypothetical protein